MTVQLRAIAKPATAVDIPANVGKQDVSLDFMELRVVQVLVQTGRPSC